MPECDMVSGTPQRMPSWVPDAARLYLDHTEAGAPIRALARAHGCHASTILRRIRHCESRRDDLLVDDALRRLARYLPAKGPAGSPTQEIAMPASATSRDACDTLTEAQIEADAPRILRRLCEPGAVLAVAAHMDNAVVVRDGAAADAMRTAIVSRAMAEAMALKDWICCDTPGRVSKYRITRAGRSALNRMMARAENAASGFAEAQMPFEGAQADRPFDARDDAPRGRFAAADSPLVALSRRRDRDGSPFISDDLVRAGERLREDFELAQIGARVTQDWDRFLTGPGGAGQTGPGQGGAPASRGAEAARRRVEGALRDLGPGLGDIALRCCCHLEGLERAEQRMGWSARSGKIVLRIALQRLRRHYDSLGDAAGLMG